MGEIIWTECSSIKKKPQTDAATNAVLLHKYSMQKVMKLQNLIRIKIPVAILCSAPGISPSVRDDLSLKITCFKMKSL